MLLPLSDFPFGETAPSADVSVSSVLPELASLSPASASPSGLGLGGSSETPSTILLFGCEDPVDCPGV